MRLLRRIGQVQISSAARFGNALTIVLGTARLAGLPESSFPVAPIGPFLFVVLAGAWLAWQSRLSRRLLEADPL